MNLQGVTYLIKEQPKYSAAYNRVRMLCEGLNNNGASAKILFIPQVGSNKVVFLIRYFILLFRCFILFSFSCQSKAVILYGEDLVIKYLVRYPRRCLFLVERTEYSTYLYNSSLPQEHIMSIKQFEYNLKFVDGMIVCSYALEKYYKQFCEKPICRVPLVYEEGFIRMNNDSIDNHTIVYCGDMGGGKDGVDILINAYSVFCQAHPDYKLILIGGSSSPSVMESLEQLIKELNIEDKVIFTGWINRNDMPSYLENASLLVLARPANKQAEGGIPSKLAEYLSTGRPVLTTSVGDLPLFFNHSKELFFAEPGSVKDFSQKMISIIDDYENARKVGYNGANSVRRFDKNIQSKEVISFIKMLSE